jgi:hypothetical protein
MFNLARLRAKIKTTECLIRELLFAYDAAIVAHESTLQSLINKLNSACDIFSLKKENCWTQSGAGSVRK